MKHKMNPNLVKVASLDVLAYDRLEAMQVTNRISPLYYRHRESGTCTINIVGGKVVHDRKDFNRAVAELKRVVSESTNLSFSIVKKNTQLLRNCHVLRDGVVSDTVYAYFPHNAELGDPVEVFAYSYDNSFLSYVTRGVLVDCLNDIVSVHLKIMSLGK